MTFDSYRKQLKLHRLDEGMSTEDLACKCEVTRATISNIESGRHEPKLELALDLAYQVGLDIVMAGEYL